MGLTFRDVRDKQAVEGWLTVHATQILYKLAERGIIEKIEGVLKEGKESVILLVRAKQKALIVKVYKIQASRFQRMHQYLAGDPRFKKVKRSRRQLVFAWCKKEFANLQRARAAGVKCPEPITYADNMLVMSFIGNVKTSELAPELVRCRLDAPAWWLGEIIKQYKKLYKKAGLVHADLSQFNILVHKGEPWLIDLSAAVLKEHPRADEFLVRDIKNICTYFRKLGVKADEEKILKQIKS